MLPAVARFIRNGCFVLAGLLWPIAVQADITISPSSLPDGTTGTAYSLTFTADGGSGTYVWSCSGNWVDGLSWDATSATISGTPTTPGTCYLTVSASDDGGNTWTYNTCTLTVNDPPPVQITTGSPLPDGLLGVYYAGTLNASGGSGSYTWSVVGGSLPSGLNMDCNGAINGTPTMLGTFYFTVGATDSYSASGTKEVSLTVSLAPVQAGAGGLPNGMVGTPYSQALSATGGYGSYTWSLISGNLPGGMSLGMDGTISGTPWISGTFSFTVSVSDNMGGYAQGDFQLVISDIPPPPPLTITTDSQLSGGTAGYFYSQSLSASGGSGSYVWSLSGSSLPGGLSLDFNGTISGTPTTSGYWNFTAVVSDGMGNSVSGWFQITINTPPPDNPPPPDPPPDPPPPPALTVATSSLPNGTVGASYQQSLSASNGSGSYSWSIVDGSLPTGLSLDPNGTISGTPMGTGNSSFQVSVSDGLGGSAQGWVAITIDDSAPLQIITGSPLPSGEPGNYYSGTLATEGGAGDKTWTMTSGSLPAGLTLDVVGNLCGTPIATGLFNFTAQVADGYGHSASKSFDIAVNSPIGGEPITANTAGYLSFNGFNYAAAASNEAFTPATGTFELLYRSTDTTDDRLVAGTYSVFGGYCFKVFNSGGASLCRFILSTTAGAPELQQTSGVNIRDGQWHHLAATWDSNTLSLWIDGVLENSTLISTPVAGSDMMFGTVPFWNGQVVAHAEACDIRLARLSSSVKYMTTFSSPTTLSAESDTVGFWAMTQASGSVAHDFAEHWFEATLVEDSNGNYPVWGSIGGTGTIQITGSPSISNVDGDSVQVIWNVENTTGQALHNVVHYSWTDGENSGTGEAALDTDGTSGLVSVTVEGLVAGRSYSFWVESGTSNQSYVATSGNNDGNSYGFTTEAAPTIVFSDMSGPTITPRIGDPQIDISWDVTPVNPANHQHQVTVLNTEIIAVGVEDGNGHVTATLTGLSPDTEYRFIVQSSGWGQQATQHNLGSGFLLITPPLLQDSLQFSASHYEVSEGDGTAAMTITVTRANSSGTAASVYYTASDASVNSTWNGTLLFEPAETTKEFSFPIVHDGVYTGGRTVNLALSGPQGSTLGAPSSATLTITDSDSPSLTITTSSLPGGTVNSSYSAQMSASYGSGPYSWSSGGLPPCLTMDSSGSISGTPTSSGSYTVTVSVNDQAGGSATATLEVSVSGGGGGGEPPPIPDPSVSVSNLSIDSISDTAATISWATSVSVPSGWWSFDTPTGQWNWSGSWNSAAPENNTVIWSGGTTGASYDSSTGRASVALTGLTPGNTYSFSVLSSYGSASASIDNQSFTTTGSPPPPPPPQPLVLGGFSAAGAANVYFSRQMSLTGGDPSGSRTWFVAEGSLPEGLSLVSGLVYGTPTAEAAGIYNFVVQVEDNTGWTTAPCTITVSSSPSLTIDSAVSTTYQTSSDYSCNTITLRWHVSHVPSDASQFTHSVRVSDMGNYVIANGQEDSDGWVTAQFVVPSGAVHHLWVESSGCGFTVQANNGGNNYTVSGPALVALGNWHLDAVDYTSATISWPVYGSFCIINRLTYADGSESHFVDATLNGSLMTVSLSGLTPGRTYNFTILVDSGWNPNSYPVATSATLEGSFATLALPTIAVSGVGIVNDSLTPTTATMSWTIANTTGQAATHAVYYWLNGTDGILNPFSAMADNDPGNGRVLVPLLDLQAGQTYCYYVQSSNTVATATVPSSSFQQFSTKRYVNINGPPRRGAVDVAARSTTLNWDIQNYSGQPVVNTVTYTWTGPTGSGSGQTEPVIASAGQTQVSVTIPNLVSGATYTFGASSMADGREGNPVYTQVASGTFVVTAFELPPSGPLIRIANVTNVTMDTLALVAWNVIKADTNAVASHSVITSTNTSITASSPVIVTEGIEDNGQVMALLEGLTPETRYSFYVQSVIGFASGCFATDNNTGSFYSLTTLSPTNAVNVTANYISILSVSNFVSGASALITWSADYPPDQSAGHFVLWNVDTPPTPDNFLVAPGVEYDMGLVAALLTDLPLGRTNYFTVQSVINHAPSGYVTDDNDGLFYSFVTATTTNGAPGIVWPTPTGAGWTTEARPPIYDAALDPTADPDGDGLPNWMEWYYGTDPFNPDTDGDGLSDYDEVFVYGTDPLKADTDRDGLNDGFEIWVTYPNPANPDDPHFSLRTNSKEADTDGDGIPDGWETRLGSNPVNPDDAASNTTYNLTYLQVYNNRSNAFVSYGFQFGAGFEAVDPYDYSITNLGPATVTLSWSGEGQWGNGNTNAESGQIATGYDVFDGEYALHFTVEEWKDFCVAHNLPFSPDAPTWNSVYLGAASGWIVMTPGTCEGYQFNFTPPSTSVENAVVKGWSAGWDLGMGLPQSLADTSVFLWGTNAVSKTWIVYDSDSNLPPARYDDESWNVYVGRFNILTDFNRDGAIDDKDEKLAAEGKKFYFWYNDDDASGDTEGTDIPQGAGLGNCQDNQINGTRDLINFFPVWVDLHETAMLPDSEKLEVWITGACNIVLNPGFGKGNCLAYLKEPGTATDVVKKPVIRLADQGDENQRGYLLPRQQWQDGGVFFLAEATTSGTAETGMLGVEVGYRDGSGLYHCLASKQLSLSISGIEQMFRHKDLRGACGGTGGMDDRLGPPSNYPEEETNDKNFVFVHGFSVTSEQSRGWEAEVFKRMFWSGSKARFYGVDWYGDQSKSDTFQVFPDYYTCVNNAFRTASQFKQFLETLRGATVVAAHSLGNMLVSSAIHDYGAHPAKYFMINAAVATEAYDSSQTQSYDMANSSWDGYDNRLRASEWNQLFSDPADDRKRLTWRDRLSGAVGSNVYNFFSEGDQLLKTHRHDYSLAMVYVTENLRQGCRYAWAMQEKMKGVFGRPVSGLVGSNYGGWKFNRRYNEGFVFPFMPVHMRPQKAHQLLESDAGIQRLRQHPFFDDTGLIGSMCDPKDAPSGARVAQINSIVSKNLNQLLAETFPAETLPVGANTVSDFEDRNHNMQTEYKNSWPVERGSNGPWLHSDFRYVAYPYVHALYNKFVSEGDLKQ